MAKVVVIESCLDCKHDDKMDYCCWHPKIDGGGNKTDDEGIPMWCPLEDEGVSKG